MSVYMEKVDAEKNCFRFYEIRVEPNLVAWVANWLEQALTHEYVQVTASNSGRPTPVILLRTPRRSGPLSFGFRSFVLSVLIRSHSSSGQSASHLGCADCNHC